MLPLLPFQNSPRSRLVSFHSHWSTRPKNTQSELYVAWLALMTQRPSSPWSLFPTGQKPSPAGIMWHSLFWRTSTSQSQLRRPGHFHLLLGKIDRPCDFRTSLPPRKELARSPHWPQCPSSAPRTYYTHPSLTFCLQNSLPLDSRTSGFPTRGATTETHNARQRGLPHGNCYVLFGGSTSGK